MTYDANRPMIAVTLNPFGKEHIEQTFAWVSNPVLRKLFLMRGEVTWEGHFAYFERVLTDPAQRVYAVIADGRHAGNCGFKNLATNKGEGELWIYLGDPATRGRGIGLVATRLLVEEGFDNLGLGLIYLHVADFNMAARQVYRKLGFIEVPLKETGDGWGDRGCEIIRMELRKS